LRSGCEKSRKIEVYDKGCHPQIVGRKAKAKKKNKKKKIFQKSTAEIRNIMVFVWK